MITHESAINKSIVNSNQERPSWVLSLHQRLEIPAQHGASSLAKSTLVRRRDDPGEAVQSGTHVGLPAGGRKGMGREQEKRESRELGKYRNGEFQGNRGNGEKEAREQGNLKSQGNGELREPEN